MSVDLTPSRSGVSGDIVQISAPLGPDQTAQLNVILIPELSSSVQQWSEPGQSSWPLTMFSVLAPGIQVFEFRYQLPRTFTWSAFVDLGNTIVNCMTGMPAKYWIRELPIIVISHGLGGMIAKRALSILSENYYNPSTRGLFDLFSCLIFLGTPHPIYRKGTPPEHLDLIIGATMKRTSKELLSTIREEIAFAWSVSNKFEEITFDFPVISAYEQQPTRVAVGLFSFKAKNEILVDKRFCETRMRLEETVPVDANHHDICMVHPTSMLYDRIVQVARQTLEVARRFLIDPASTTTGVDPDDWQSTAASRPDVLRVKIDPRSIDSGPVFATAGSSPQPQGIALPSAKDADISNIPAVKLPCHMLRQYGKPGTCIGRSDILKQLDDVLLPSGRLGGANTRSELSTFAICGLGGMGKTQIASDFASKRKDEFDAVFFVSADSENKLSEDFNKIALQLGLSNNPDENRAVNRDTVLQWLNEPTKRPRNRISEDEPLSTEEYATYLLVFDNADRPELLTEFWPINGTGSILITSRDPHTKSQFYATQGVELGPLDLDDAAELLQNVVGLHSPQDQAFARLVSERLGGLPLALMQVAGLLQRRKLSFEEFLEFYNEPAFLAEVHRLKEKGLHNNYEYMLFNVWTFDELKPEALCLLELCSILDPDRIKENIFTSGGQVLLDGFPNTPVLLDSARSELLKCSLLKRFPEEKEVVIHRVVQDATLTRMSETHLLKAFASATNLLLAAWPTHHIVFSVEPRHWPVSSALLPHTECLRKIQGKTEFLTSQPVTALNFASLMVKAGWLQCERGNYEDVLVFCETAEAICIQHKEISASLLSDLDFLYAFVCTFLQKHDLKLVHAQRKVDYHKELNNQSDSDWLIFGIACTELAMHYIDVEKFEEAVFTAQEALDVYSNCSFYANKSQMPIFPRVMAAWGHLGLGDLQAAEDMIVPCVEWIESSSTQWDFNAGRTGVSLYTLGSLRQAQGRLAESYQLHERALVHYRTTMGKSHYQTAKAFMKMSEHAMRLGHYADAEQYIDSALEAWSTRQIFEGNRARAYFRKAQVYSAVDNDLKAKGVLLKAEKLRKNWLKDHVNLREPLDEDDFDALVPCWAR